MFEIRVIFIFCIGLLTFFNFVSSKNDGWLLWTQWSECPDLICSGERYKPLIRRSRECRNTVFGEDVCGDETIEVEEKNCRPNIPECTHEWTLWTNVSPSSMTQTTIRKYRYTGNIFQWSKCTIPCFTPDIPKSSGRNTRSRDCNHIKNKSKGQDQYCEGMNSISSNVIL